jgi:hypothetical protein
MPQKAANDFREFGDIWLYAEYGLQGVSGEEGGLGGRE